MISIRGGVGRFAIMFFSAALSLPCPAQHPEPTEAATRAAIEKALPLLHKGSEGHMAQRTCFACHNQAHVLIAMRAAERFAGIETDAALIEANAAHTLKFLDRNREGYAEGRGQGGQADTAGYALWLLELAKTPPNDTTTAVAEYLLRFPAEEGYWRCGSVRPPSEASHFATTHAAMRGLKAFASEAQAPRMRERLESAKAWLLKTTPADTEDAVFRLRGLLLVEAEKEAVAAAAQSLWDLQREDGGFAQTKEMESDAYATGSALAALAEMDIAEIDNAEADPAEAEPAAAQSMRYARGAAYLLRTQEADGSWRVKTRSKPFQEYFETGFPHEKDQFLSSAATSWAVAALAARLAKP